MSPLMSPRVVGARQCAGSETGSPGTVTFPGVGRPEAVGSDTSCETGSGVPATALPAAGTVTPITIRPATVRHTESLRAGNLAGVAILRE